MTATEVPDVVPAHFGRRKRITRRLLRRPLAVAGLVVVSVMVLMAVVAPVLAPYGAEDTDFGAVLAGPSAEHVLGTDDLGRDTLSRVIFGSRASLQVGVLATLLALVFAAPLGMIAGYYRGWRDPVIMRATDVLLAFPFLVLAVGLAAILGPSLTNATIALGLAAVPNLVRVTRGETLALREEDYVRAAIVNGASDPTILRREIFPNLTSTLLVQTTVTIPVAIIGESLLSFLGLGVQPPTPSWGTMLSSAQPLMSEAPSLAIYPGLAIFLVCLAFNLLGDGLRDALDPRTVR